MRIDHSSYQKYIDSIANSLEDAKLFSPILLNNETIVFPSMEENKKSFVISLNINTPLVYLINDDHFFSGFENKQIQKMRKIFGKSVIKNLKLNPKDNIVTFSFANLEFNEDYNAIVELIPNHPNLVIIKDGKIIDFYFHSKFRNFAKNETYELPPELETLTSGVLVNEKFINDHHQKEWEIRKEEKYRSFTKYLKSKINLNEKKIKNISNDVTAAKENLRYENIANEMFTLGIDMKSHQKEITIGGETFKLNESKTYYENIDSFFKKVKKAKETISRSEINLENARQELKEYKDILNKLETANEKTADELMALYGNNDKKKEIKKTIFNRPYYINLNGTIIYFGHNASQNDYLSFVMKLDREFTWLHIKDKSGAHLVIANKKPTENELLFAAEISLLCSRVTSGEIVYTKKKNVRRGHTLGEALLKNYSTIKINSIRKETIEIFALAKRVD